MSKKQLKRAPNGSGTIRKRKDNTWEARYTAPDGRQRSIYGKTEPEVKAKLKKALAELTLGLWFKPNSTTVNDWINVWMEQFSAHIKQTTRDGYSKLMRNYVIPTIGNVKLSQLKLAHVQLVFNTMAKNGLSSGTQQATKIALSSVLTSAVKHDILKSNPCKDSKIGKTEEKELVIIDRPDFPAFFEAASKSQCYVAIMLIFETGIRSSELRGLRWSDVDLQNKKLHIRQQIVDTSKGTIIQTTKTYKRREVVLIDKTVTLLKAHKKAQLIARVNHGGWVDDDISRDLVFRLDDGRPYPKCKLYYPISKIGKAIGIEGLHPHSLRDSYAVAALRSGVDVKTVQHNLGHKNAAITLNMYAKYTDDAGQVAAQKFAAYLSENSSR